jgi:hypothetical protein
MLFIHEQDVSYTHKLVSKVGDVFVHWCQRYPFLLVKVNIENTRIRIFYVFTLLITESKAVID